ncbi:hypothetical protein LUZ61_021145 [Rhynchospora tenuis]|uniref:Protein kinase domain-containing protein n=1 Tax=Rhynchospora tenuis TaxID=198213 RepID=A0AAD5W801_9POAL|nr:hypothetical protein LUZ61_021145 [Rhynchospora tenuis]
MLTSWTAISTNTSIDDMKFDTPSMVLQTAAVPSSGNGSLDYAWSEAFLTWLPTDKLTTFFVVLHFAEIEEAMPNNNLREFYIYANGELVFKDPVLLDTYLSTSYAYFTQTGATQYSISLRSSARATLPPILNALELYTVLRATWLPTDDIDGTPVTPKNSAVPEAGNELNFDKRKFTFAELKLVTNNFSDQIGDGGFGKVLKGRLENGVKVAVKLRTESSSQGIQHFQNEVETLSRVHHKNLVSLIGYCKDGDCIALVYEYIEEGNLENFLRGRTHSLGWKQRLQIAYESGQGLEYLHKMCKPPLIHRDIKTSNILLTSNFEAKVSDFGLVQTCSGTHVSTQMVRGTPGYVDPYYAVNLQLTVKSDVYSFGIVLLEIITGKSPILQGPEEGLPLTEFVQQELSKGNIESILDPNIGGQYNLNSIWKVADLALRCTDLQPTKRPDMRAVVAELKESLDLEISTNETGNTNSIGNAICSGNIEATQTGGMRVSDYGPSVR